MPRPPVRRQRRMIVEGTRYASRTRPAHLGPPRPHRLSSPRSPSAPKRSDITRCGRANACSTRSTRAAPIPARADGRLPKAMKIALDPVTTLTFAAAATSRVTLGTSVICMLLHNPVVLAKQLATLDVLSGGRFRPGLGQGWSAGRDRGGRELAGGSRAALGGVRRRYCGGCGPRRRRRTRDGSSPSPRRGSRRSRRPARPSIWGCTPSRRRTGRSPGRRVASGRSAAGAVAAPAGHPRRGGGEGGASRSRR